MSDIPYIITRSKRSTISLHIEQDGKLVVKAPKIMPELFIRGFVRSHAAWIEKHMAIISRQQGNKRGEDEYLYLGKLVTLTPSNVKEISVRGEKLLYPQALLFRKGKELESWFISQAKLVISAQVEKYAVEMSASYKEITFSDTKSQWGRCTQDNRLQFNWRLIMAPLIVLNYVVVHELAHTMEKNHTQLFWMKVRNINPSYRQQIKWLKENGASLKIY